MTARRASPLLEPNGISLGSGPFLHNDPATRPEDVYSGTITLHIGPAHRSHLIIPVIPD
jgi:hypothetical protein